MAAAPAPRHVHHAGRPPLRPFTPLRPTRKPDLKLRVAASAECHFRQPHRTRRSRPGCHELPSAAGRLRPAPNPDAPPVSRARRAGRPVALLPWWPARVFLGNRRGNLLAGNLEFLFVLVDRLLGDVELLRDLANRQDADETVALTDASSAYRIFRVCNYLVRFGLGHIAKLAQRNKVFALSAMCYSCGHKSERIN